MRTSMPITSRRNDCIIFFVFVCILLNSGHHTLAADASSESKAYITTAANGEMIPNPISTATYTVRDGEWTILVPEGMVYVPPGSFVMGYGETAHTVTLSGYCISKYLITNAQYKVFYDEKGSQYRATNWPRPEADLEAFIAKKGNHPVLGVSFNNAAAYCAWVSKNTGWTVKVPSEAQWERAARGPTTDGSQYIFPWGNDLTYDDYKNHTTYMLTSAVIYGKPLKESTYSGAKYHVYWPFVVNPKSFEVINQKDFSVKRDNIITTDIDETSPEARAVWDAIKADGGGTTPVGSYPPSRAGCYDMAGNACEVTRDWHTESYYIALAGKMTDPVVEDESVLTEEDKMGGSDGDFDKDGIGEATKVVKGGSWYAHKSTGLSYARWESRAPNAGTNTLGFRVVAENPALSHQDEIRNELGPG